MKQKSLIYFFLAVTMLFMLACGCQADQTPNEALSAAETENGNDPVKLTMYVGEIWQSTYIDTTMSDPIAKALTEKTGVTLDVSLLKSEDADTEMNLMIASGTLPDLIFKAPGISRTTLISGGYVTPLDDLIEKYAPDVKKNLGVFFDAWREEDGKLYGLGSWNWNQDSKYVLCLQVNTLHMRYDILKELGYEKLERGDHDRNSFITVDEYMALLDRVRKEHPDMIPALLDMNYAYDVMMSAKGMQYSSDITHVRNSVYENGSVKYKYATEANRGILEFINNFYLNGYLPDDFATLGYEQNQNLIATGQVFSTFGQVDGLNEAQSALCAENDERRMVQFYLIEDESVRYTTINNYYSIGSPCLMISSNSPNKERAMKFFDYCASIEGSTLICSGTEGECYTVDENGLMTPNEEVAAGYAAWDTNSIKKFGIGAWDNVLPVLAGVDENGNAYECNAQHCFSSNKWVLYNVTDWKYLSYPALVSCYNDIDRDEQEEAFEAKAKIEAYARDRIVRIVASSTKDEFETEYGKFITQMQADNVEALNSALQDNWLNMCEQLGREKDKLTMTVAEMEGLPVISRREK